MKKNYFPHDFNARNDENILRMLKNEGLESVAIFWFLIEMLYEANGQLKLDYEDLCFSMRIPIDKQFLVKKVVENYELFDKNGEHFTSPIVLKTLQFIGCKSKKAKKSAEKRWENEKRFTKKLSNVSDDKTTDANAMRRQCEGNAIKVKESKVKESKVKEIKEKEQLPIFLQNLKGFPEAWLEWNKHRIEIGHTLKPTTIQKQISFLLKQPDPVAVINKSIQNGWQGLFEVRGSTAPINTDTNDDEFVQIKISDEQKQAEDEFAKLPIEEQERKRNNANSILEKIMADALKGGENETL